MTPLDRDFAQFARTAEPAALGRVYNAAAVELLQLATRLAGDPVEAEDLVQATFVAAIESAKNFEPGKRVMPWLVGILTNRARRLHQARQRNGQRAGMAPATVPPAKASDDARPTPTQHLEKQELDTAVAEALQSLSSVLHPVVVLHLRHGMEPAEIAYALQRPPATVRSQLARGLATLRKKLPRKFYLPALLAPIPRGLDAMRVTVLEHGAAHAATIAPSAAGTAGAATAATTTVTGALIMMKQLKAAAIAAILLALGASAYWLPWGDAAPAGDDLTRRPEPIAASTVGPNTEDAPTPAGKIEGRTTERVPVAATTLAGLRCTVRTERQPLVGAVVELLPTYIKGDLGRQPRLATDADGVVHFVDLPFRSGHACVRGTRATAQWLVQPGETEEVEIVVTEPGWVHGRVLGADGMPRGDATVWVVGSRPADEPALDVLRTARDGTFVLPAWGSPLIGARAPGHVAVHREVQITSGKRAEIELQLRADGAALHGRVVRGGPGHPVAGAKVEVGDRLGPFEGRLLPDGSRMTVVPQTIVTRADGTFQLNGLLPGMTSVHAAARGSAPARETVRLTPGGVTEVTLTLPQGARVHGRVTLADGRPARETKVHCGAGFARRTARVDRDGRFTLDNVPPGWQRFSADQLGGHDAHESHLVVDGEDIEWNPVLNGSWSQIRGALRDEQGQPLADWWVVAHKASKYDAGYPVRTAEDGSFLFEQLRETPEVYELRIHPPCEPNGGTRPSASLPAVMSVPSVQVGSSDVEVIVPGSAMPTAWVNGRVAATVKRGTVLWLANEDGSSRYIRRDREGKFSCGPLAPGRWRILVKGFPVDTEVCSFVLHPRSAHELGTIEVGEPQFGEITIVLHSGQHTPEFQAEFRGIAAAQLMRRDARDPERLVFVRYVQIKKERTTQRLATGSYVVRVCGAPVWAPPQDLEVTAGGSHEVTFRTRASSLQRLAFRHPRTKHPFEQLELALHDAQGVLVWSQGVPPRKQWWHAEVNLVPGTYRVTAKTASGLQCDHELHVKGAELFGRPIVFDLIPPG